MDVKIKKLHADAIMPEYKSDGAACFDLCSVEYVCVRPNDTKLVGTGLAFAIPEGYVMRLYARSGLSAETGLRLANCVGTIDSDYRGEVKVIFDNNFPRKSYEVVPGQRIAQGVIEKLEPRPNFVESETLPPTKRGDGGFGSTGK